MTTNNHPKEYSFFYESGIEEVQDGRYILKKDYEKLKNINKKLKKRIQELKCLNNLES